MRAQLAFLKSDVNRALLEGGPCPPPFQFGVPLNHAHIPELARKHLRNPLFFCVFLRESNTLLQVWGWCLRPFFSSVFGSGGGCVFGGRGWHEGDCSHQCSSPCLWSWESSGRPPSIRILTLASGEHRGSGCPWKLEGGSEKSQGFL